MERALPSHRRLDWHYIVMQAGYWAMFAAIVAFQTALLLERGFSNTEVGIVIAVRCGAGILCQPLLGGFADRHPKIPLKLIVSVSLVLSLGANLLFIATPMGLGGTLAVFVVVGGFEVSAYPLMDAMAVQYISVGVPIRYSLGRGIGSLAYAITCAALGLQVGRLGVESTLVTHAALVVVVILLCITYPTFHAAPKAEGEEAQKPQSVFSLLKSNPRFTLMLCAVFLALSACLPMSNFIVNVLVDRGGTEADLGLALFLMGASELPTAFFFQRLLRRFGSGKLLLISMGAMIVKSLCLLLTFNALGVFLCQPMQMLGYGLFTPASVFFVSASVPEADRVRGQTIMMVASNGLGGMVSGAMGGALLDLGTKTSLGGPNLLLVSCVVIGSLAALLGFLAVKTKHARD